MDDWASITADPRQREWLLAVARITDPNPVRNRLRQPDLWRDGGRLTQIADGPGAAEVTPQLAVALDRAANQSNGNALPLLFAVQARYPRDFWLNFTLAVSLLAAGRPDEAVGYDRVALAVRPEISVVHDNLGTTLLHVNRKKYEAEALAQFKEALRLDPRSIGANVNLGTALINTGDLGKGVDHVLQAMRLDPNLAAAQVGASTAICDATRTAALAAAGQYPKDRRLDDAERTLWRRRALDWLRAYLEIAIQLQEGGQQAGWSPAAWQRDPFFASVHESAALAKLPAAEREQWRRLWADVAAQVARDPLSQGQDYAACRAWAQAADGYARALKHRPTDDGHFWFEYAAVLLLSGDRPGYARACAHMAERCGKPGGPRAYHVARACTLAPDAVADAALPGRLAAKELEGHAREFWSLTEQGALAYRAGRFQEAVPLFEQSLRANPAAGRPS